jgi:hypothetical protein
MIFYRNLRYLPVALKSENLPMGWKEAIYTYPSSIVYEIHGAHSLAGSGKRTCTKLFPLDSSKSADTPRRGGGSYESAAVYGL